jgi:hypothetical protein
MKNLPERIYLNFDFEPDQSDDFKDFVGVTHSSERIFKHDIEYVRKDVAEQMEKEFGQYCWNNMWTNKTLDELFTEFINQSK